MEGRREDPAAEVSVAVKLQDLLDNTGETRSRLHASQPCSPSLFHHSWPLAEHTHN